MVHIHFENRQKKVKIDKRVYVLIEKAFKICLKNEIPQHNFEIGVIFLGNDEIRELNRKFRNIDSPTDVLSFPLMETDNGKLIVNSGDRDMESGLLQLGDVIIAPEKALENITGPGHDLESEMVFLAVHGVLHLLGYEHENCDSEEMFRKQELYLKETMLM